MPEPTAIRDRYLQDNREVRLGGLAANLARASTCMRNIANKEVVYGILQESKWFVEWTASDFIDDDIETAAELVVLQIQLSMWQMNWTRRWSNTDERPKMAAQAKQWSERVLEMSGILART